MAKAPEQANGASIHATGQPDTPIEVLTDLLGRAVNEKNDAKHRELVSEAYRIVSGLDPYLEKSSTPPSQVNASVVVIRPSQKSFCG